MYILNLTQQEFIDTSGSNGSRVIGQVIIYIYIYLFFLFFH